MVNMTNKKLIVKKDPKCRVCTFIGDDLERNIRLYNRTENLTKLIEEIFTQQDQAITIEEINKHIKDHIISEVEYISREDIEKTYKEAAKKSENIDVREILKVIIRNITEQIIEIKASPGTEYLRSYGELIGKLISAIDLLHKIDEGETLNVNNKTIDFTELLHSFLGDDGEIFEEDKKNKSSQKINIKKIMDDEISEEDVKIN